MSDIYSFYQRAKDELAFELVPNALLADCGCSRIRTTTFLEFVETVSDTPLEDLRCLVEQIDPNLSASLIHQAASRHHANLR